MTLGPFDPEFADLPEVIAIFPLTGVLLLPGGRLPLNIFEPRYLAMTRDAIAGDRIIGMCQPLEPMDPSQKPDIYDTGCAGRITAFSETDDGRYLITLAGLCRFDVVREQPLRDGYRQVVADYAPYAEDFEPEHDMKLDRDRLIGLLKPYFASHEIEADWEAVENAGDQDLITSLAMMCPFAPPEKQALLQSPDMAERADMIIALMEMAVARRTGEDARH